MSLRVDRKRRREPQGLLPFEYEASASVDEVTPRAGLPLVLETFRALRLDDAIGQELRVRKRNAGFDEVEHIEALVLLLAAGGECMGDMAVLGADVALLQMLDERKLPSPDATRQFLHALHDETLLAAARAALGPGEKSLLVDESQALRALARVQRHLLAAVHAQKPITEATLEGDSTFIESHKQEATSYYEGGRGYQPAIVYCVEHDLIVADQFRDANVPAAKRPLDAVREGFAALPEGVTRRFRGDSAFAETHMLQWLCDPNNRIERFTVSTDMEPPLRQLCLQVSACDWKLYEERARETVSMSEVEYVTGNWPKDAMPMRTIVLRIEPRQLETELERRGTKFLAIRTNDFDTPLAELIGWHYAKAGQIEPLHDVLENELGAGVMPCGAFGANAAWFRLNALTYNVLSAMKRLLLPPAFDKARPKRLRFAIFAVPARLLTHARRLIVRIAQWWGQLADWVAARRTARRLRASTALARAG